MAEQNQGVFVPLQQADLQGPFSENLVPSTKGLPINAGQGRTATLAKIGLDFLGGVSKGRINAFQKQEADRVQKMNRLISYVNQIEADPRLTKEAKAAASQKLAQVMGTDILQATEKSSKGKDKEGGQGMPGHIGNILREIAIGMTGGKMPKGTKDVGDLNAVIGDIYGSIYGHDGQPKPEFNAEGQISGAIGKIQESLKGVPKDATQEDALKAIAPHLQAVERIDPARANSLRQDILGQYQPAPRIGSPEYRYQQYEKSFQAPPQTAAPSGQPGPPQFREGSDVPEPQQSAPPGTAAPVATQPGAPTAGNITPAQLSLARMAGKDFYEEKSIDYGEGPKAKRMIGYQINVPGRGIGWYDSAGNKLDDSQIRLAGVSEPKGEGAVGKPTREKNFPVPGDKHGHNVTLAADGVTILKDWGRTPVAAGTQRQAAPPRLPTEREKLTARNVAATAGLSKILRQNAEYAPSKENGNRPVPIYLRDVAMKQHYLNDPEVAPYFAEITKMLDTMARQENMKTVKDFQSLINDAHSTAKTEQKQAKIEGDIEGITKTLQGIDQDLGLIGGAEKQDSVSYDEVAR